MNVQSETRAKRIFWVVLALALVVVAGLAWATFSGQGSSGNDGKQSAAAPSPMEKRLLELQRRDPDDPMAIGRADAPVVMTKYEDFRCPFCSKFSDEVEPELVDRYVRNGTLRIEWRDFPIFGEQSVEMAKAGRAAANQDRFWQFQKAAYAKGDGEGHPDFPEQRIKQVAREAGVRDLDKFNADRRDPSIMDGIRKDTTEGEQLGISSTPSFIVNGQVILGAQPLQQFVSVIEEEKDKA